MTDPVSDTSADDEGRGGERRVFLRGGSSRRIPVDDVFRLLADRERRVVLRYLRETAAGTGSIDGALEAVTEVEREFDPTYSRERAGITLHHVHLPQLAGVGVVDYDERSGTIRYHEDDRLERALDLAIEMSLFV